MPPDCGNGRSNSGISLARLLWHVPADAMLTLVASMLLERRIVFVSQSRDTVTAAVQAAQALLYPFKWVAVPGGGGGGGRALLGAVLAKALCNALTLCALAAGRVPDAGPTPPRPLARRPLLLAVMHAAARLTPADDAHVAGCSPAARCRRLHHAPRPPPPLHPDPAHPPTLSPPPPLRWHHILLPILPKSLMDYLTAPMPFMVGLPADMMALMRGIPMNEITMIDLDLKVGPWVRRAGVWAGSAGVGKGE